MDLYCCLASIATHLPNAFTLPLSQVSLYTFSSLLKLPTPPPPFSLCIGFLDSFFSQKIETVRIHSYRLPQPAEHESVYSAFSTFAVVAWPCSSLRLTSRHALISVFFDTQEHCSRNYLSPLSQHSFLH